MNSIPLSLLSRARLVLCVLSREGGHRGISRTQLKGLSNFACPPPSPLFFPHHDCLLLLPSFLFCSISISFSPYVAHVIGMGGCSYLADSMCTTGFGVFSIQISHPPGLTLIDIIAAAACPISQNQFWATLVSEHIGWRQSCYDVINAELMDSIYD